MKTNCVSSREEEKLKYFQEEFAPTSSKNNKNSKILFDFFWPVQKIDLSKTLFAAEKSLIGNINLTGLLPYLKTTARAKLDQINTRQYF